MISQSFLIIKARFKVVLSLNPRPPSSTGRHNSFHATFALPLFVVPFHKKFCILFSISYVTFYGKMKAEVQYKLTNISTDFIICTLPAYESAKPSQPEIRLSIFNNNGRQSAIDNLEDNRGSPKHLIGRSPSWNPSTASISSRKPCADLEIIR